MNFLPTLSNITRRRLAYATLAIVLMIAVGAIGFHSIEGLNWIDSVYIATETVTTVGYGDIPPRTTAPPTLAFARAIC
ncbi:MAG: potassium channel family protein [Acidobacteriota bacterium]|nr:potassium channel family protein [Acidobacteriota bacterium]